MLFETRLFAFNLITFPAAYVFIEANFTSFVKVQNIFEIVSSIIDGSCLTVEMIKKNCI